MAPVRHVTSTDGVQLAVYETGPETGPDDPAAPVVLAVHGYPDNHTVWDGVVAELSDRFRVVTYDVRGTGESSKPAQRAAYRMPNLVDDLGAVLDAVSPEAPVHLLAHDWGSIQAWAAVTDEHFADRIATFTSISGPSLDHAAAWLRDGYRHPRAALRQLLDSWYIFAFQVPRAPEALMRSGRLDRLLAAGESLHRSALSRQGRPERGVPEKVNGIQLYRANMLPRLARPQPRSTRIPVQVLAPRGDMFVSVPLQTQAPAPYVAQLTTRVIAGGHWVVVDRPDLIARHVAEFAQVRERAATGPVGLAPRPRAGTFAGQRVVVTGGGRGIGRACALEFAREGADVIVADINDTAAKETAALVQDLGVHAAAYHLDVSDAEAWEAFAAQVRDEHGVPDVIVNNAGIGISGRFLATSVADWQRILGVNLWGVIHGSRLFGQQMVERGEGGRIVNVASAAAFTPSRALPAYSTTKAAVLMLTECLRAELAGDGIGVTAICPGFVDSDITRTTTFVGVDETEQQRRRDHAAAAYHRRNYSPERLARHAVRAAARNKPVAAISVESKAMRLVNRAAPPLARLVAKLDLARG
ncbi:MAG TPA: SDR family oxidoreductase [Jatrophihabitantaceae bacterium]|nr:SDR family oxidoreductase [Jatrophihabitantaceae bacterium]